MTILRSNKREREREREMTFSHLRARVALEEIKTGLAEL